MKKKNLLVILLSLLLFASCQDYPDELTVTINDSGTISVNVVDLDNKPIANAQVDVVIGQTLITDGQTNQDGIYKTQLLLQNYYYCYSYVEKDGMKFNDSKLAVVMAGKEASIKLSPLSNVADLSVKVVSYNNSEPIAGLNVAIMPYYDSRNLSQAEIITNAPKKGKSDSDGIVKFDKIPALDEYYILVYDDNNVVKENNYAYLNKGDKRIVTFNVW